MNHNNNNNNRNGIHTFLGVVCIVYQFTSYATVFPCYFLCVYELVFVSTAFHFQFQFKVFLIIPAKCCRTHALQCWRIHLLSGKSNWAPGQISYEMRSVCTFSVSKFKYWISVVEMLWLRFVWCFISFVSLSFSHFLHSVLVSLHLVRMHLALAFSVCAMHDVALITVLCLHASECVSCCSFSTHLSYALVLLMLLLLLRLLPWWLLLLLQIFISWMLLQLRILFSIPFHSMCSYRVCLVDSTLVCFIRYSYISFSITMHSVVRLFDRCFRLLCGASFNPFSFCTMLNPLK